MPPARKTAVVVGLMVLLGWSTYSVTVTSHSLHEHSLSSDSQSVGSARPSTLRASQSSKFGIVGIATVRLQGCSLACSVFRIMLDVTRTGSAERHYGSFTLGGYNAEAISSNGRWFAYSDPRRRVHLVDLRTSAESIVGHGEQAQFSHDGRYLALSQQRGLYVLVDLYDTVSHALQRVARGARFYGQLSWAHRADRLVISVSKKGYGIISASHPQQLHLQRVRVLNEPSDPAWTWNDSGLLYWDRPAVSVRLENWTLATKRARTLASFPNPSFCGKGCDWQNAPLAISGGVISRQPLTLYTLFSVIHPDGAVTGVSLQHHRQAIANSLSVNEGGNAILLSWGTQWYQGSCTSSRCMVSRARIAVWHEGVPKAFPHGRGFESFWIDAAPAWRPSKA
jgi:hypothetical protein